MLVVTEAGVELGNNPSLIKSVAQSRNVLAATEAGAQ
jgi:hypothetical protein